MEHLLGFGFSHGRQTLWKIDKFHIKQFNDFSEVDPPPQLKPEFDYCSASQQCPHYLSLKSDWLSLQLQQKNLSKYFIWNGALCELDQSTSVFKLPIYLQWGNENYFENRQYSWLTWQTMLNVFFLHLAGVMWSKWFNITGVAFQIMIFTMRLIIAICSR